MEKELLRALKKCKSKREKVLLLILNFPEEGLEKLLMFMRAHLKIGGQL